VGKYSIGIEIEDEYVKIGLRRLQLAQEFKGEKLEKEARTFETDKTTLQNSLNLFERNGTYFHQ
jgi:adenine-specific DNA-methyltransferase